MRTRRTDNCTNFAKVSLKRHLDFFCKRGVVAAGPRDVASYLAPYSSSTGGSRTHRHQALSLTAMPVRVPCRRPPSNRGPLIPELRARESNHGFRAYETRLGAGPPAWSQAPVSSRAGRPYEGRRGTCHA
jgi:hypothetical protein